MKTKSIIALIIGIMMVILIPMVGVAEDETAPGVPFQALQEQIDDIQAGIAKAYSVNSGSTVISTDTEVMSIDLPPGDYVSNISLGFRYTYAGFEADAWAFVDCGIYADGNFTGYGLGGNVCGIMGHSTTQILSLTSDSTTVTLRCELGSECCGEYCTACANEVDLELLSGSWTLIRVDRQN